MMCLPARRLFVLALGVLVPLGGGAVAGPISPPAGPVTPTMKTLEQIEPRRPVQSLPGSTTAGYVISEPGSYYLTGDIAREPGKVGIEVASPHVTIDLGGFSLIGAPGAETFNVGIRVSGPHANIAVRNGTIRGWGYGMSGNNVTRCVFEDLAILDSTAGGLEIGSTHSSIFRNLRVVTASTHEIAIVAGDNCVVEGCVVSGPGSVGIVGGYGCVVSGCAVSGPGTGIFLRGEGVVTGCSVRDGERGVHLDRGGLMEGCEVAGCSEAGVVMGSGVSVLESSIRLCGEGIATQAAHLGGGRIDGNTLVSNGVGLRIDSGGNTIVRNVIRGSTAAAMQIAPGNAVGTVQASPVGAGPWDNIAF